VNAAVLATITLVVFALGYRFYASFLAQRIFALREDEPVPARELEDGVDFVPTRKSVLWGHHYTSIAGAAPIVGPALAVIWGWLPALVWVTLGTVFMGAVHDFGALVISLRNRGRSIGEIAGSVVSPRVRALFLLVISLLIWIVLAVFAFIIGTLFVANPGAIFPINVQIIVAMALGWLVYRRRVPIFAPSLVGYGLLLAAVFVGNDFAEAFPAVAGISVTGWVWILLVYSFFASVLPVWLLLQPRDYLNAHQLITALVLLFGGLLVLRLALPEPTAADELASGYALDATHSRVWQQGGLRPEHGGFEARFSAAPGTYDLIFEAGAYFDALGLDLPQPKFLDQVVIRFGLADTDSHYHVPLLISPFGYSTYRGS